MRLEPDGSLVPVDHRGLDVDTERVVASLGGQLLPCLVSIDEAHLRWSPPVADDGPRLVGISAGELFAFVRSCVVERGYDLRAAGSALDQGVAPDTPSSASWC